MLSCCVVLKGYLRLAKRSLHLSILSKNSFWGLEGLCDRWVRELCIFVCHTNHSVGCIKERIKLPVKIRWYLYQSGDMSVYCTLFSQTFYGLLFCYLTITDVHVTLYLQIIDFQFTSCCTLQPPKKLDQIITVNSSTNTPRSYHQKNNSCTLCVPMFTEVLPFVLLKTKAGYEL